MRAGQPRCRSDQLEAATADELLSALDSPAGKADPYAFYWRLRELAPLHRSELDGTWYASGYDDCRALLVDPRCGRPQSAFFRRFGRRDPGPVPLRKDPEHARLRGLISRAFTPKRVEALRPRITEIARPMLETMSEAGAADVMSGLAFPLPIAVIGELVGVPPDEREPFRAIVRDSLAGTEASGVTEVLERGMRADEAMEAYFFDLVARRRVQPGDDLLSGLVGIRDAGGPLSEEELVSIAIFLFNAGFVTTTNLIGNGLLALLRHPRELQRLWAAPTLVPRAVEEMLRWDSPAQLNGRTVFEAVALGGRVLEAGENVILLLGAANRDPARFSDPDRFDVGRADNAPLSFGGGAYHCLGASLARLEAQTVFRLLAERFAGLELADEPTRAPSFILRGLDALPVRLTPR